MSYLTEKYNQSQIRNLNALTGFYQSLKWAIYLGIIYFGVPMLVSVFRAFG